MLLIALVSLALLFCGFGIVWAIETRARLIMTPLVVAAAYMGIRVLPAMIYAASAPQISNWLPFAVAVCAGFAFTTGYALANHMASLSQPVVVGLHKRFPCPDSIAVGTIIGMLALNIGLGLYLYGGVPSGTVALIGLIGGEEFGSIAAAMAESRATITKGHYFGGADRGQGLVRDLAAYSWPLVILFSALCFAKTRKRVFAMLAAAGFFLSFVFIAGDGTRAPFLNTIIIYAIAASLVRPLRARHIVAVVVAVIGLGVLISVYSQKAMSFMSADSPVAAAIESVGRRILLGNAINDALAIDLIDREIIDYRDGQLHLRDFQAAIPGVAAERPFSYELFLLLSHGKGTTYLTGTYLTKPFVDFGIVGVLFAYLLIGVAACAVFRMLMRLEKNPLTIAIAAISVHALAQMVLSRGVITLGPSAIVMALCLLMFSVSFLVSQSVQIAINSGSGLPRLALK